MTALNFIHEAGWVHRDVDKENMYWSHGRGLPTVAKKVGIAAGHEIKTVRRHIHFSIMFTDKRLINFDYRQRSISWQLKL